MSAHPLRKNNAIDPFLELQSSAKRILPEAHKEFDGPFFQDISYYISKKLPNQLTQSELISILQEALVRLSEKLNESEEQVLKPVAYYRTIVRNLVNDLYRDLLRDERFLISTPAVLELKESGVPKELVRELEKEISPKLLALRTLQDKLKTIFEALDYNEQTRRYFQGFARRCFQQKGQIQMKPEWLANVPDDVPAEDAISLPLNSCIEELDSVDRDLIRLRFGIFSGMDGFQFSFEELKDIFDYSSVRKIQNRYYYLLKQLRQCLEVKGYPFG
ncbi:MAG: hypothetical protein ACRBF0_03405 [Calditrichia bacterium]